MSRRRVLFGAVAAVAAAAGAGLAWRRDRSVTAPAAELWTLRFDRPGGGQLGIAAFRGRPLLLNFWATWCPPCVSELPLLDRFFRDQPRDGWQVAGLAVDNLAPVLTFLAKHPVTFPIGLAGAQGIELARQLGNASGALPYTAVFDRTGTLVQRKLGVIEAADLQKWAAAATG
jgi:thiol-disulfide isomerase/thioredoxin